jgi:hypothetical protein
MHRREGRERRAKSREQGSRSWEQSREQRAESSRIP